MILNHPDQKRTNPVKHRKARYLERLMASGLSEKTARRFITEFMLAEEPVQQFEFQKQYEKELPDMRIFQMNETDTVLHHSFEEAVKHYDNVCGAFEDAKDEETGESHDIETHEIYVHEPGDKPQKTTVKKALEQKLIDFPAIFSTEGG